MVTNDSTTITQVRYLLDQIGLHASILEAAMDKSDSDEVALYQASVGKIGYLAEIASNRLGDNTAGRGGAERWFLHDSFFALEEKAVDHG
jgi:hypothetical protein